VNCDEVARERYIDKYLLGERDEAETEALEEHYFECDDCYGVIKNAKALRSELATDRWAIDARSSSAYSRPSWAWVPAAAAVAVLLVGTGVALWLQYHERPPDLQPRIAELTAIEAPPYSPKRLRSSGDGAERAFREAMVLYQESDFTGAIPGLEAAARLDSQSARSVFYLGACYLLVGQPEPAAESFARVVALGESPYLERARLYRAKALLRIGRFTAAADELREVVRINEELAADAQRILDQLPR
jgi:tetratricopeptide (TPR) repeat protein